VKSERRARQAVAVSLAQVVAEQAMPKQAVEVEIEDRTATVDVVDERCCGGTIG
jgi:hypothetical protein